MPAMSQAEAGRLGGLATSAKHGAGDRNAELLAMLCAGHSQSQVARRYGICGQRVRQIIRHAKAQAYDALVEQGIAPPIPSNGEG
jgi:DNA-binding CsgD family transcriptional regulator